MGNRRQHLYIAGADEGTAGLVVPNNITYAHGAVRAGAQTGEGIATRSANVRERREATDEGREDFEVRKRDLFELLVTCF